VTTDFDNDLRSATTPDIGADELVAGGAGTLQFNLAASSVGEAAGTATITVTRTGGSTGSVMVDYATVAGGTATGGAACGAGVDYVNASGTLTFGDGVTSQMFTITICNDAIDEVDETVNLMLSNAQGGATIGAQSTAVLTITDDDPPPSIAIASPSPLPEGNAGMTPFNFGVSLSSASSQTVTVHYQTADGTATTANNDYVAIPDTVLTFNPGETFKTITVQVNGDLNVETNETFAVNLSLPVNATLANTGATGTIVNDDAAGQTLSINDVRTREGDAGTHVVTFTVTLSNVSGPAPTVHYQTFDGTAIANSDYVPIQDTVLTFGPPTLADGIITQTRTISVTINGDLEKEANETFFVSLFNATNATISDDTGVCIIVDEDRAYVGDMDDDERTDLTVFRTGNVFDAGYWYSLQSANGITSYKKFGADGDKAVPGDYDGDARMDLAVFRPSNGTWFILNSSNFVFRTQQWGLSTDKPAQGDYDGDDKTDIAVFRDGVLYVLRSSDGAMMVVQFGAAGDKVVPGDYDGDAQTDLAVFRGGVWYVRVFIKGQPMVRTFNWGNATDTPVSGDFDGDGKTDIAVFRDGVWYIIESLTNAPRVVSWGAQGDRPVAADYDGDGTSDIAVWRPSNGNWYIQESATQLQRVLAPDANLGIHWGQAGDVPAPFAYVPEQ
jgi:hypothetical protein